jgi:uncharacterized protein YgbK (DUF1537 family)
LLPFPGRVVVASIDRSAGVASPGPDDLVVRNTQSRTCAPATAATRVRAALTDVPAGTPGVVLKKIDTALRGAVGAELDAAMDATGATTALVLAAIPEVGRTTVGGRQLIDGVPIDRTAFARDPQNPIRDARVGATIEATSRRRTRSVSLDELGRHGAREAVARCRAEGASIVVGDAESDGDLARWMAGLMELEGTIVLAGSTGLARAWRATRAWPGDGASPREAVRATGGVLIVAGSAHPVTRAQLDHVVGAGTASILEAGSPDRPGCVAELARRLRAGGACCLVAPSGPVAGGSAGVLDGIASVTGDVLACVRPAAMILVGGETAYHVLARLGHPRLGVDGAPAPLAVRATILDGAFSGMPVVTKGGSSGPPERLAELIAEVRR